MERADPRACIRRQLLAFNESRIPHAPAGPVIVGSFLWNRRFEPPTELAANANVKADRVRPGRARSARGQWRAVRADRVVRALLDGAGVNHQRFVSGWWVAHLQLRCPAYRGLPRSTRWASPATLHHHLRDLWDKACEDAITLMTWVWPPKGSGLDRHARYPQGGRLDGRTSPVAAGRHRPVIMQPHRERPAPYPGGPSRS